MAIFELFEVLTNICSVKSEIYNNYVDHACMVHCSLTHLQDYYLNSLSHIIMVNILSHKNSEARWS